jgi:hypothetical protein
LGEAIVMTDALSPTDKAVLELAVEVTRKESVARRQQIDDFLATREWFDAVDLLVF